MEDRARSSDDSDDGDEEEQPAHPAIIEWLLSSFSAALLVLCHQLQRLRAVARTLQSVSPAASVDGLDGRLYGLFHCLFASHESLSATFTALLLRFFSHHLDAFQRIRSVEAEEQFRELCALLKDVRILSSLSPVSSVLLSSLLLPVIRARIADTCEDERTSHLEDLRAWTTEVLVPFARIVMPDSSPSSESSLPAQLLSSSTQLYTAHLISRLFDLIVAFPASTPLLNDLHSALPHTSLQPQLLSSLTAALHRRLLHPGASTSDILHTLIGLVRGMRLVEDDGVTSIELVRVISDYVRARPDCVRCIMRMLVGRERDGDDGADEAPEANGDGEVDLSDELERERDLDHGDDSDSEDTKPVPQPTAGSARLPQPHPFSALPPSAAPLPPRFAQEAWTPDPLSAHPFITSRKGRHADLLTILFSLTPPSTPALSLAPFLDEYRSLLASRLVGRAGYGRDEEVVRNERMKARVGEEEMVACEVMVRDIENSKRVVTRLVKETQQAAPHSLSQALNDASRALKATRAAVEAAVQRMGAWTVYVLSHEYWPSELLAPSLAVSELSPPTSLLLLQSLAAATYHRLFSPRTLTFLPLLGSCDITVELRDRTLRIQCDPLAFAVLSAFEGEDAVRSIEELRLAIGLSSEDDGSEAVRAKVAWWMSKNVLKELKVDDPSSTARYAVIEELSSEDVYDGGDSDTDEGGSAEPAEAARSSDASVVDEYVLSMLSTFGELSCDPPAPVSQALCSDELVRVQLAGDAAARPSHPYGAARQTQTDGRTLHAHVNG